MIRVVGIGPRVWVRIVCAVTTLVGLIQIIVVYFEKIAVVYKMREPILVAAGYCFT